MSEVVQEMVAFQWGVFLGFADGMAGMAFMWWMTNKGGKDD